MFEIFSCSSKVEEQNIIFPWEALYIYGQSGHLLVSYPAAPPTTEKEFLGAGPEEVISVVFEPLV